MKHYTVYPILGSGVVPVLVAENNVSKMQYLDPQKIDELDGDVVFVDSLPQ